MQRRAALAAMLAGLLPGCGFRPLYGDVGNASAPAVAGLSEVAVGLIPERTGQLLRLALQDRLERGGMAIAKRYDLAVTLAVGAEAIAIRQDNTTSRYRLIGTANWTLLAQDPQRSTLTSGTARQVDGYNVFNQQYFAADLANEAVQRRMMEALADSVVLQLAAYFNRRAVGA